MKRVIILCEGVTEREFCKNILASYFAADDIHIQAPLIKKSMGGIVNWVVLKKEIETHLKSLSPRVKRSVSTEFKMKKESVLLLIFIFNYEKPGANQ